MVLSCPADDHINALDSGDFTCHLEPSDKQLSRLTLGFSGKYARHPAWAHHSKCSSKMSFLKSLGQLLLPNKAKKEVECFKLVIIKTENSFRNNHLKTGKRSWGYCRKEDSGHAFCQLTLHDFPVLR